MYNDDNTNKGYIFIELYYYFLILSNIYTTV